MKYMTKVLCETATIRFLRSNPIANPDLYSPQGQPAIYLDNGKDTGGPWLLVPESPRRERPTREHA